MAWSSPYQLRILKGNQQGAALPLTEQVYILGRATSQGETAPGYIFFYEPTVSRVHAELRWNEKKKTYFVHHQSKTNPTLVEGVPVDKKSPRALEKGHKIQMGYLVLEVELVGAAATRPSAPAEPSRPANPVVPTRPPEEAAKTHKMMVGNILEALSNLSQERNQERPAEKAPALERQASPARAAEPRNLPPGIDPGPPPRVPTTAYLERDYGASDQEGTEIQFTVAQGPDQGQVFVLREQVGIIGRAQGRDDPRRGQGVLLHDESLPKEAAYLVWQNRDQAYGLSEADNIGVAIRVRRVQNGQPVELAVGNGPPVLLRDSDVLQLGGSILLVRCKNAAGAPVREWAPTEVERSPQLPVSAGPTTTWERPKVKSISLSAQPDPELTIEEEGEPSGGIVPRNYPGASGTLVPPPALPTRQQPPAPAVRQPEPEPPALDPSEVATHFRMPTPPEPPRHQPTVLGRGPGRDSGSGGLGGPPPRQVAPAEAPPPAPAFEPISNPAPSTPLLDPSTAPTLGTASARAPLGSHSSEERSGDMQPLSWPWRDSSDFVFDFTSGVNRGRQIALNASEMHDDRMITLGTGSDQFDIPLDGPGHMATLRYRSRRFALLNQGPDDSVQVNRVPLKRGDQVVLMTGDRIDIGESSFRFLERSVVEVLQGFQVVVESGVEQDQDKVYPFAKQRLLIGRGKTCDVRLTDLEVSRIHIALVHRDGKFFVQHRSETNPTFLNGMSLLQGGERLIQPGDRVRLSSLTLLQFAKAEPRKRSHAPFSPR